MRHLQRLLLVFIALPAWAEDHAFFESKVRPVLVEHCFECHSGEKTKGGLALDTKQAWEKGGDSGPAIVPGKPDESLLITAVRYHEEDLAMPPKKKGGKLPDAVIADLVEWVKMGAPDPRIAEAKIAGMKAAEAKTWWAFQPLPKVASALAEKPSLELKLKPHSIDDFIDTKLTEAKITPAAPADPRTLIRRLSYDLTGLPPSAEEVEAFVKDPSASAVAKFIEHLLASPQYGVQWGRHWLDVVRYADTAGENTDRPLMHAWRYRNWVFDSFNRDLPYDEFVRAQLAGDLLFDKADAEQRSEGIVATGYLAIARRFGHDIEKDMYLTHEDVIDTLGKNFLGLTTGCARCHDHKYDPITAADYYALYGIFSSTRFAFPGCEPKGQPRDMVPLITPTEVDALMKPWQEKNAPLAAAKKRQLEAAKSAGEAIAKLGGTSGKVLAESKIAEGASAPFEHRIHVRKGEVVQLAVSPNASHGADTTIIEWHITETDGVKRSWSVAELVPGLMKGNPHPARDGASWCFLETTSAPAFLTDKADSLNGNSALQKWSIGDLPSVLVNSADQQVMAWTTLAAESFFVHPGPKRPVAVVWISPLDGEITLSCRVGDAHPITNGDGVSFELKHIAAPEYGPALAQLGASLKPTAEPEPMPVIPVAYAVVDSKPKNDRLHLRGDPEKLGDEVPRRWLSILGGESVPADSGSGRKELGDWIAQSPLAARVMVNRIWEWHFGKGLVSSSNDFGSRGEKPTHPELLDWLAAKFVESGFSVKAMHRLILSSAAYQRSSFPADSGRPADSSLNQSSPIKTQSVGLLESVGGNDPENRLLAHFPRRRLTAEEMRDSLLAVSGQLDLTPAEAHPFPAEATWKFSQHNPFNAVYDTTKRSAYLMVQRQRRHPFLSLFDGADPNATTAARQTTTVPTQALYFINDPFFHARADALARKLVSLPDDETRITAAWRILFQRKPTAAETQRTKSFLASYPADNAAKWTAQERVLMASNEFLHVD